MMKPEPMPRPPSRRALTFTTAGFTALTSSTQFGAGVVSGLTLTGCSVQIGAADAAPPGAARILVADDNADMRAYLGRILGARWAVETHADGAAALAAARARPPDLVLSDVMMPGLDGFGLLKQLFAKGYAPGDPTEASFAEYVERPRGDDESLRITFSEGAGRGFYEQIENAFAAGDDEPFIDFSKMPKTWRVPPPAPRR